MHPRVGHDVLVQQLTDNPNVHLRLQTRVASAEVQGNTVQSVTATDTSGAAARYVAKFFLDATDLGELLPLANVEHVVGAKSRSRAVEPDGTRRDVIGSNPSPFPLRSSAARPARAGPSSSLSSTSN